MISKVPQLTCFNQTVIEDLNDFNDFSAKGIHLAPQSTTNHQYTNNLMQGNGFMQGAGNTTTTNNNNMDYSPRPVKFNLKIKSSTNVNNHSNGGP